jgi:cystinosin
VAGFSLEFAAMNPNGFFFYSVYSVAGSVDPFLGTGSVHANDLLFALHAFAMSAVQLTQIWMYDRGKQGNVNVYVVGFLAVINCCALTSYIYEVSGHPIQNLHWDTFLVMGYCKAAITFVKYVPQVYLNYKRQSTVGWSLANVLLDLTGGTLSLAQMWIDAACLGQSLFGGEAFNIVKFILSIMSIIFDTIFLIQHYVLYGDARKKHEKEEQMR